MLFCMQIAHTSTEEVPYSAVILFQNCAAADLNSKFQKKEKNSKHKKQTTKTNF